MAEYPPPVLANSSVLFAIALRCAVAVWIIEVPILLTDSLVVAAVFCAGWLIIFAYTFYRAWDLRTSALLNYDTGVIRFLGSVFAIALARGLYGSRLRRFHPRRQPASCCGSSKQRSLAICSPLGMRPRSQFLELLWSTKSAHWFLAVNLKRHFHGRHCTSLPRCIRRLHTYNFNIPANQN